MTPLIAQAKREKYCNACPPAKFALYEQTQIDQLHITQYSSPEANGTMAIHTIQEGDLNICA